MSRRIRLLLMAVVVIAIVALCWFALLNPIRGDIAAADASIETERTKLAAAQAKLSQAEITRQDGQKNQARLLELAKMVPESEEVPSLLLQIQDLADQSGIAFISITPGDPVDAASFRIIPLEVRFSGTFFNLSDFVYRAEQMVAAPGRLLAVKDLKLQLGGEGVPGENSDTVVGPTLAVNMTLYAFESVSPAKTVPTTAPGALESVNPVAPSSGVTTPPATSSGS